MNDQENQMTNPCPIAAAGSTKQIDPAAAASAGFVAINYIACKPDYRDRFECLFCSRARMIDNMPGFLGMKVLRCTEEQQPYLVVSFWTDEASFQAWVGSPQFHEGHKRAFEDLRAYKERGEEAPMKSDFKTYSVIAE